MHQVDKRKVRIVYRGNRPRWNEIWENNPRIARPDESGDFQYLCNGPGERPYIADKHAGRWIWRDWVCTPGEIFLRPDELAFGERYTNRIIIEPHIKHKASPNKDWGMERWARLVGMMRHAGIQPTQLGPPGTPVLYGAELVVTNTFRAAAAVLAHANACVLPEGGLHHAAEALGVPAVVIFGGFISPKQTGYANQVSFFTGGKPCGMRVRCSHCIKAMSLIEPREVFNALENVIANRNQGMARPLAAGT